MQSKIRPIFALTILSLIAFWSDPAVAADKTETLKGTITLGRGGYGLKLDDGKVIRFMGRGGNTVFSACHKGDRCEVSGVVLHDASHPLFLSVTRARKLAGPALVPAVDSPVPPPDKPVTKPATPVNSKQAEPKKTDNPEAASPTTESNSPFLLDDSQDK